MIVIFLFENERKRSRYMEALKQFDIDELLKRQSILDEKFDKKETIRKRDGGKIQIAALTELGETTQELKSEWNYWKNSTKDYDKEKLLEELSDYLHFILSLTNYTKEKYKEEYNLNVNLIETGVFVDKDNECIEFYLFKLSQFNYFGKMFRYELSEKIIFIKSILKTLNISLLEFLRIHHKVYLRNLGERTKENY